MNRRLIVVCVLVFAGVTNSAFGAVKPPIRLATATFVVGSSGGKTNSLAESLGDLVTARLSREPSFILIERQKIDTVLDEIARSLSQESEQQAVIKAGQFIAADWFLLGAIPVERTNLVVFKLV